MILTNLLWKLHCQILQTYHSICVHSCHWLNWADKDKAAEEEMNLLFSEGILMRRI